MGFVKTDIYDLQFNPYKLIGKDWFLLTSGNKSIQYHDRFVGTDGSSLEYACVYNSGTFQSKDI